MIKKANSMNDKFSEAAFSVRLIAMVTPAQHAKLISLSESAGTSMAAVVRQAINKFFEDGSR